MFRRLVLASTVVFAVSSVVAAERLESPEPQLRLCLRSDPKTLDPLLVDEESGETIRYLTGGVLIRFNRSTQKLEPELAEKWKVSGDGRTVTFLLRKGVQFSDGSAFTAQDAAATLRRLVDPAVKSPMGDSFRAGEGIPQVAVKGDHELAMTFPYTVAGVERLFDQVAISPSRGAGKDRPVLGAFVIGEHVPGNHLLLKRNPYYWRRDNQGRSLPYLSAIRFDIQGNRDIELMRFRRRELDMISGLDANAFEELRRDQPNSVYDAGPSFDNEMLWFNQVVASPLPEYKKQWFRSQMFRRALSGAINRDDIVRLVYRGHAKPGAGPVSDANLSWFNRKLKPHAYAVGESLKDLQKAGFRLKDGALYDAGGKAVEFSVITNSGNKSRVRIATLIQQDLKKIGIRLNVVPLDFPALIERISRNYDYEACLLGLVNVDVDPNSQMNVWLSSAANHQWNPRQRTPETAWEAEIDRLMRVQAGAVKFSIRKAAFDRVQEIVSEQVPFVYLVTKNSLAAADPHIKNLAPSAFLPQLLWNAPQLTLAEGR